jgi:hypothetical protein
VHQIAGPAELWDVSSEDDLHVVASSPVQRAVEV